MPSIFNDKRRGQVPFMSDTSSDTSGDGALFDRGGVAGALCGWATTHHPLLTPIKKPLRHDVVTSVRRP